MWAEAKSGRGPAEGYLTQCERIREVFPQKVTLGLTSQSESAVGASKSECQKAGSGGKSMVPGGVRRMKGVGFKKGGAGQRQPDSGGPQCPSENAR